MIHKTAIIDSKAIVAESAQVGPYCVIGPNVVIGENACIAAQTGISGSVNIGKNVTVGGKVGFAGAENKDGTMPLKFDYTVLRNPKDADTLDNQEFIDYIGDILVEVMEEKLKDGSVITQ